MSDKKYPYIGDNRLGQIVLIYGKDSAYHIRGQYQGEFNDEYNETGVKNITHEYLTNTYGKCESQEHADFICELAENNGFNVINDYSEFKGRIWFVISCYRIEFFSNPHNTKLIHLPLPPKEKGMPEVKSEKPIYTKEMHERGEWPHVGSEIVIRYNFDSKTVTHRGEVLYISSRNIILNQGGVDVHYRASEYLIEPIPTIEDELRDLIVNTPDVGDLTEELLTKFNITPKEKIDA